MSWVCVAPPQRSVRCHLTRAATPQQALTMAARRVCKRVTWDRATHVQHLTVNRSFWRELALHRGDAVRCGELRRVGAALIVALRQLERSDLVGAEHGEPGVAVGCDGDTEWLTALDCFRLGGDHASSVDLSDASGSCPREPHRTVRGWCDVLWPAVEREHCRAAGFGIESTHGLRCEPRGEPHSSVAGDVDGPRNGVDVEGGDRLAGRVESTDEALFNWATD